MSLFDRNVQKEILREVQEVADGITDTILKDVIAEHADQATRMKNLWNRYRMKAATGEDAEDGVKILARAAISDTSVNHKLNHPFERKIVSNKVGYMGEGVTLSTDEERAREVLEAFVRRNSVKTQVARSVATATVTGTAFMFLWSDGASARTMRSWPWESAIIRDEAGVPQAAIRYWDVTRVDTVTKARDTLKHVEWYDARRLSKYTMNAKGVYQLDEEPKPHMFQAVPAFEFMNDPDRVGHIDPVRRLIDAYDLAVSDLSSEITQMRLAYLVQEIREGYESMDIDDTFKAQLRETGVLLGNWRFLEKDLKVDAVNSLTTGLREAIYHFSDSYDPDALADGSPTAFQISQKLKGLEDASTTTENMFREAFIEMFSCLAPYWANKRVTVDPWQINQTYPRNIPRNTEGELVAFTQAGGRVSNRTLLEQLSFVDDVDQEIERIAEEDAAAPPSVIDDNPFEVVSGNG